MDESLNRLTTDMDDLLNRLTADMDRFFFILRTYFRTLGLVFWTFDHSLVVEGSLGVAKVTVWVPGLDFL